MFLKIVGIFAEFERENLAERVRLGLERKAKEGYSVCTFSPSFGYSREKGNKIQEINEETATVKRIFDMYMHDDSNYTEIADTLNAEKIPTKFDKKWNVVGIKRTLTNPNYVGKVRYATEDKSRYFEAHGQHEPIIDEQTYYQVQEKISKTQRISYTKHPTSGVYFCGVLYCELCGDKYTSHWRYKKRARLDGEQIKTVLPSYRCQQRLRNHCCTGKTVSHNKVTRAFEQYITNIENLSVYSNTNDNAPTPDNSAEIAAITAEVRQIEKKTEEIMSLFVANTIDFPTYQGMVKISNERRGELQARLILLESAQAAQDVTFTAADIVTNFRDNWAALDNEQRQEFIQKFIKKIVIHHENIEGKYFGEVVFNEF
jgi:site-specific DNA recombinase